jgi:hypothetical protein
MNFQQIVVLAIIGVAIFFGISKAVAKRKSFSTQKGDCGKDDCRCGK